MNSKHTVTFNLAFNKCSQLNSHKAHKVLAIKQQYILKTLSLSLFYSLDLSTYLQSIYYYYNFYYYTFTFDIIIYYGTLGLPIS